MQGDVLNEPLLLASEGVHSPAPTLQRLSALAWLALRQIWPRCTSPGRFAVNPNYGYNVWRSAQFNQAFRSKAIIWFGCIKIV